MARVEGDLWWYRALHRLVLEALARHPRGQEARIVDAGCGTGGLLRWLHRHGYRQASGFDLSPDAIAICHERGLPAAQADLRRLDQVIGPERVDALVSNDTLCYFPPEEQARLTQLAWQVLAPGGLLVLNLPAFPAFRGIHDLSVGIRYRFSRPDIPRLLPPDRYQLVQARFWPFCLAPVIYLARCRQRLRLRHAQTPPVESDVRLPPRALNCLLETLVRLENAWLPWKPFGSSLFLVGRKQQSRDR